MSISRKLGKRTDNKLSGDLTWQYRALFPYGGTIEQEVEPSEMPVETSELPTGLASRDGFYGDTSATRLVAPGTPKQSRAESDKPPLSTCRTPLATGIVGRGRRADVPKTVLRSFEKNSRRLLSDPEIAAIDAGDVIFIVHTHAYDSIANLIKYTLTSSDEALSPEFSGINIAPENVFMLGKYYSQDPRAIEYMRKTLGVNYFDATAPQALGNYAETAERDVCSMLDEISALIGDKKKRVIVLDDGGKLIKAVINGNYFADQDLFLIEQTMAGHRILLELLNEEKIKCPYMSIANSLLKTICESPLIANAIAERAQGYLGEIMDRIVAEKMSEVDFSKLAESRKKTAIKVGVIGKGNIGDAVYKKLVADGYTNIESFDVKDYPDNPEEALRAKQRMCAECDVIFECVGKDVTADLNIDEVNSARKTPLTLLSCGSGDAGFNSFLQQIQAKDPERQYDALDDLFYDKIHIACGGTPITFGSTPAVDRNSIDVTIAALLYAVKLAFYFDFSKSDGCEEIPLNPDAQIMIANICKEYGVREDDVERLTEELSANYPEWRSSMQFDFGKIDDGVNFISQMGF
ncbi:MAG: hypothetical protein JXR42_00445 [Gammaproteobacteria bacterium]|nr:hypothetical protein [Gammaproteobacteria bacterium]